MWNMYGAVIVSVVCFTTIVVVSILVLSKYSAKFKKKDTEVSFGNADKDAQLETLNLEKNELKGIDYKLAYFIVKRDYYLRNKREAVDNIFKNQRKLIRDSTKIILKRLTEHFEALLKENSKKDIVVDLDEYRVYAMATEINILNTRYNLEDMCEDTDFRNIKDSSYSSDWKNFKHENICIILAQNENKMDMFHIADGVVKKEVLKKLFKENLGKDLYEILNNTMDKLRAIEVNGYEMYETYENAIVNLHKENNIEYIKEDS